MSTRPCGEERDLVGLTPSELEARRGAPSRRLRARWEYAKRLGPGAHSFQAVLVVRFARGRVREASWERRAVGCIVVPPPDPD